MPRAPDLSGCALDGRYELHAIIGEGTFGRVYRGLDRRLARRVAVKVIKPWWAEDPDWLGSFEREAQLLASISDPGIVQIFDVGSAPEGLYYVAELVEGESLAERLRAGPLAPLEAAAIAEQLARALERAHAQRVVHRDVKPANVLITGEGRIKVGDFGLARLSEGSSDGAVATIVGTPRYMAPEQARGGATSPATDVYGVGVVLYEMLAGRPPFPGSSAVELAVCHVHDPPPPLPGDIPEPITAVVTRALAKAPGERYPDGGALADALAHARAAVIGDATPAPGRPGAVAVLASAVGAPVLAPGYPPASAATPATRASAAAPRAAATRVGDPRGPRRNVNPSERRQRIALFALIGAMAAVMVAAAVALAPGQRRVPRLTGLTRARVVAKARQVGFRAAFGHRYSLTARGIAIAQSPAAGQDVSDAATVRVILSAGPAPVAMPALVGSPLASAQALLATLKLRGSATQVPAPGITTGTVTRQVPNAGAALPPGSTVMLSVAQPPRWWLLTRFAGSGQATSVPFRIRGRRWRILYSMSYQGTCTLLFICSGPSAKVVNLSARAGVDDFDLGEGAGQTRTINAGPGVYQVSVTPGSDAAGWTIAVQDRY
jgi:serine/threonine-protein kinase